MLSPRILPLFTVLSPHLASVLGAMQYKSMALYQHDCDLISDQCIVSASLETNDQHLPQAGYFTILTFRREGYWPVQYAHDVLENKMYYRTTTNTTFVGVSWISVNFGCSTPSALAELLGDSALVAKRIQLPSKGSNIVDWDAVKTMNNYSWFTTWFNDTAGEGFAGALIHIYDLDYTIDIAHLYIFFDSGSSDLKYFRSIDDFIANI